MGAPSDAKPRYSLSKCWQRTLALLATSIAAAGCLMGASAFAAQAPEPWPLWERYCQRFVDTQGRVIDHGSDDRTTSEGEAYALFFALVDNDRGRFDSVFQWTEANLAGGDMTLRLPAWSWGKSPETAWKVLDANSASDADLWIAYSLLEAGRVWHERRYERIGSAMALRIAREEVTRVPGLGTTLIAGGQGFHPDAGTWLVNPSYLPLPVLSRFASAMPSGPWKAVIASLRPLLAKGSSAGYAMDWVAAGSAGIYPSVAPVQLASGGKDTVPIGSYDAIRVYLWLGIANPAMPGRRALMRSVEGMAAYLRVRPEPPEMVDRAGKVLETNGPVGFSAAMVPYLSSAGFKAEAKLQMERVASMKDVESGLYGGNFEHARYYDQNLILFATGWAEGRYRFERDGRLRLNWKSGSGKHLIRQ